MVKASWTAPQIPPDPPRAVYELRQNAMELAPLWRGFSFSDLARSSSPILLGFPVNCRCARVLHLEPIRRAPRTISRVLPLRHDALAKLASTGEDGRAIAFRCSLNRMRGPALATTLASVALRTSSGSRRKSSPFSSIRSKASHRRVGALGRMRRTIQAMLVVAQDPTRGAAKTRGKRLGNPNLEKARQRALAANAEVARRRAVTLCTAYIVLLPLSGAARGRVKPFFVADAPSKNERLMPRSHRERCIASIIVTALAEPKIAAKNRSSWANAIAPKQMND